MNPPNIGVADRLAIQELLAGYCHAMDVADAALCAELFADDAVLDTGVGAPEGRAQIEAWIRERLAQRDPDYQVGHFLLNPLMFRVDAVRVRVRSMLLYTRQARVPGSPVEVLSTGIYEDEVMLRDGQWRFTRRCFAMMAALDARYLSGTAG